MIEPQDVFWVDGRDTDGETLNGNVLSWDERRQVTVTGPASYLSAAEDLEIEVLERCVHLLGRNVYAITVDDEGSLVSVSSDTADDPTFAVNHPNYFDAPSLFNLPMLPFSQLVESDRLGPGVDLMRYTDGSGVERQVVFKYSMIFQRLDRIWSEMHLVKSLDGHPNLVPFGHIVIDDKQSQVLGFTTVYIPGQTLEKNTDRTFRLAWLQQLTAVVDYLNLEFGIAHQDIAPRNLLVGADGFKPAKDKLLLFDFDRAARIGRPGYYADRNDVTGVILTTYEIITRDSGFRSEPFPTQALEEDRIMKLAEWPVRCELDADIAVFRQHLKDWVRRRRRRAENVTLLTSTLPEIPDMPTLRPVVVGLDREGVPIHKNVPVRLRRQALECGDQVFSWQRPPFRKAYPSGRSRP